MKQKLNESVAIPEGVTCVYTDGILKCKKGAREMARNLFSPGIEVKIIAQNIKLHCPKGNKNDFKTIKSFVAHLNNIFRGLDETFTYKLESANVHFPMTVKVEKNKVVITNFLGEKVPRFAKILPNVEVKISGSQITITSPDREAAGQTAANLEQATKVLGRDRRIYQDGIYITEKPGRNL